MPLIWCEIIGFRGEKRNLLKGLLRSRHRTNGFHHALQNIWSSHLGATQKYCSGTRLIDGFQLRRALSDATVIPSALSGNWERGSTEIKAPKMKKNGCECFELTHHTLLGFISKMSYFVLVKMKSSEIFFFCFNGKNLFVSYLFTLFLAFVVANVWTEAKKSRSVLKKLLS